MDGPRLDVEKTGIFSALGDRQWTAVYGVYGESEEEYGGGGGERPGAFATHARERAKERTRTATHASDIGRSSTPNGRRTALRHGLNQHSM